MNFLSKPQIKLISVLLIVSILLVGFPLKTRSAALILWVVKEFGLDGIARFIASKALNALGGSVINQITSIGRDGTAGALAVQDWRRFVVKSNQRGEDVFRTQLAYLIRQPTNVLCPGSKELLRKVFNTDNADQTIDIGLLGLQLRGNSLDSFQSKIHCTIPEGVYNDFKEDFQKGGGWNTWSRMVEPQNNFYGLLSLSVNELNGQRIIEKKADTGETRSPGFVAKHDRCTGVGANAQCAFLGEIVTPAHLFGEAGAETIDSSFQWLTTSDEIVEVIFAILDAALSKLGGFLFAKSGGLISISPELQGEIDQQKSQAEAANEQARQSCINACINNNKVFCQDEAKVSVCVPAGSDADGEPIFDCNEESDQDLFDSCMDDEKTFCEETQCPPVDELLGD